jgi:hypothetical protein
MARGLHHFSGAVVLALAGGAALAGVVSCLRQFSRSAVSALEQLGQQ